MCNRMRGRGITVPDSQEGIDCCLECNLLNCVWEIEEKPCGRPSKAKKGLIRQLYSGGLTIKEIATELGISTNTVQRHLRYGTPDE